MTRIGPLTACMVSALIAIAGAAPQVPVRDNAKPVPPPTGKGRISGTVKDQSGNAVRRATVSISGDMRLDRMTITDDDGAFSLSDLPSGRFSISAVKAGYPQVSYGAKRPYRTGAGVFLQEGEHASNIALVLARGAAITGTVYDEDGAPLPGVPVMAWEVRTALGGARTLDYAGPDPGTVITDDRGEYRVFGLAPGDYTVGTSWYYSGDAYSVRMATAAELRAAFAPPNQPPRTPQNTPEPQPTPDPPLYNYSPVFSPGVLDALAADTFSLKAGDVRTGADLRMQFQPTSRIEGTITDPRGLPISVELMLTRRGPVRALNTSQVRPGQSGSKFTFQSLSPGLYSVIARSRDDSSGAVMSAVVDVTVIAGETSKVALNLQPAASVTGRVVFEGTELTRPADLTRTTVRIVEVGEGTAGSSTGEVSADGAVKLTAVPGQFVIRASVPGGLPPTGPGWTVRSVTVGGQDVTDRPFDFSAGANDLVVTFASQVSELSGTLATAAGLPETDYFVIAIPADKAYWVPGTRRIVSTRPDANGRYVFRGLPAGDYRIAVTTDLVPRDLQEMNTIEQLAAASIPATLAHGERKTVNIRTSGQQ